MSKKHALLQPDIVILAPPTYATPRPTHIDRLPGPQPPRHEPVTGRERTNSKSSPQRPRGLPPSYRVRFPTVRPCPPPNRVRFPTVRPCPPPNRVRFPTVSASRPSDRVRLPTVSASRPCPLPDRPTVSASQPCPLPDRVRFPTVRPCPPPNRVRFPTVSASRPSDHVRLPTVSASWTCPPPNRVRLDNSDVASSSYRLTLNMPGRPSNRRCSSIRSPLLTAASKTRWDGHVVAGVTIVVATSVPWWWLLAGSDGRQTVRRLPAT